MKKLGSFSGIARHSTESIIKVIFVSHYIHLLNSLKDTDWLLSWSLSINKNLLNKSIFALVWYSIGEKEID